MQTFASPNTNNPVNLYKADGIFSVLLSSKNQKLPYYEIDI